jgi:PhoH-like ATPase
MAKRRKVFVLDTNVILHDWSCIYHFAEHDVAIPISVIEELDRFKKGDGVLNLQARAFLRSLDSFNDPKLFNGGVAIPPAKGRIRVVLEQPYHDALAANFPSRKPDHMVLNTALNLASRTHQVVLVTKDANLRVKARSLGMTAEDYTSDHVKDLSGLYKGRRTVEHLDEAVIERMHTAPFCLPADQIGVETPLFPNEYVILRNGKKSALGSFSAASGTIRRLERASCYGITPRNAEQAFALDALVNPDIPLVTLSGQAGTGKTLLALAAALETRKAYRQIYVSRPVVPLSNRDIGYLPGDIQSKLDPYMQPLFDNLAVIEGQFAQSSPLRQKIRDMMTQQKIVITPLTYIRGRSLVDIFFIVDEAQNLTPHEIKTVLTRAGEGTKLVLTGDVFQIDHPYLDAHSNGLAYLIERMKGQSLYAHINLEKGERSELAQLASQLL